MKSWKNNEKYYVLFFISIFMVITSSIHIYRGKFSINHLPIYSVHNNDSTIFTLILGLVLGWLFWKKLKD